MVETIGIVVLGALGASALASTVIVGSVTVATVVGTGALVGASILASYAIASNVPVLAGSSGRSGSSGGAVAGASRTQTGGTHADSPGPEAGHQALKQPIPPRMVGYGRNRMAGSYLLYEEKDGISYDIIAFHHGRIGGIYGFYLHDDAVERHGGTGFVLEGSDGRYGPGDKVYIAYRTGVAPATVYGEVTSALPEIWTNAHLGNGLATLYLQCNPVTVDEYTIIYPRGKPEPSVVCDCAPIFNPLDEAQTRENQLSWTVNSNPVLELLDVLTNTDRGMGLDWDTLIAPVLSTLMDEVNNCATTIAKIDGGEARYASDGFFSLDSDPVDAINTILDTCDGWMSENGDGTLALFVGLYREPTVIITSADVKGFSLQKGVADEEVVNEIFIDYTEPEMDYKTAPAEPWRDDVSIAELGRVRSQRLSLPWVQSASQARRLAKRRMMQLNAPLRGTLTTSLFGLSALGQRWVRVQVPEIDDLADVVIEIKKATIDLLNSSVSLSFISVNPNEIDAWDPETEEGSQINIPAKLVSPAPPIPQGLVTGYLGGQFGDYIIHATFIQPVRGDLLYQMRYRVASTGPGGGFFVDLVREAQLIAEGTLSLIGGYQVLGSEIWEVQVRSRIPSGIFSDWSDPANVGIPVPEGGGDGEGGGGPGEGGGS